MRWPGFSGNCLVLLFINENDLNTPNGAVHFSAAFLWRKKNNAAIHAISAFGKFNSID